MDGIDYGILQLVLISSLIGLVILGIILLVAIKMIQGGSRQKRNTRDEEGRLIQEIYQGLRKMELRVESLETILFERDRKRGRHDQ